MQELRQLWTKTGQNVDPWIRGPSIFLYDAEQRTGPGVFCKHDDKTLLIRQKQKRKKIRKGSISVLLTENGWRRWEATVLLKTLGDYELKLAVLMKDKETNLLMYDGD